MKREENRTAIAEALSHPLRVEILNRFHIADTALSPKLLAQSLGEPLTNVSYHVRQLEEKQMIALVDSTPRRGALEHFYELSRLGRRARIAAGLLLELLSFTERELDEAVAIEFTVVNQNE